MMHVIRKPVPNTTDRNYYGDDSELSSYELDKARESGADLLIYWYADGGYDGTGYALLRKDGKWILEYLGHCSCYGPFDTTPDFSNAQPLSLLKARVSEELLKETAALFTEAETLVFRHSASFTLQS